MRESFFKLLVNRWPAILIAGLVLLFFYPVWLQNKVPLPADLIVSSYLPWRDYTAGIAAKNPITTDAISYSFPMRTLAIELIKKGQPPLWNPYILAGTPLLANFQSAPFSPTNLVYFLFDTLTAWSVQVALQHILAAAFTYLLLRRWKVSRLGATIGGIIFAFSGFNLIWSQWNAHALSAAFIPLILFFEDRWIIEGKVRDGVGLSVALALQILSGYPQAVLYTLVAMGLLWLVRSGWQKRQKTVLLGVFASLGITLSGIQVLPGAELLSLSQREVEPIPRNWAFLPWEKTITFVAPDFFGNHATGDYWGPQNYTSNTGFVGVVAAALALLGMSLFRKDKAVTFSLLLLIVSLVLSFATPISVFLWESNILGLQAGTAHRALVLFNLSVALLAGFGLDYLSAGKKGFVKWQLLPLYFLMAAFGIYALLSLTGAPQSTALENLLLPLFFLIVTALLLAARKKVRGSILLSTLFIIELFIFGWKYTPFSARDLVYPKTPVLEFLESKKSEEPFRVTGLDVMPVNQGMAYKLEFPGGYDAVYPLQNAKFIAALNSGVTGTTPQDRYAIINNINSPLVDLMNTKYLLVKSDFEYNKERYAPVFSDRSVTVLENKKVLPHTFTVNSWEVIEDEEGTLARLLEPDFPLREKIILESDVSAQNLLFISDTWYPGWKAFANGRETKIHRANFAFRAIELPEGEHNIQFIYAPQSYKIGKRLSLATVFLLVALFIIGRRYERKESLRA